MTGRQERHDSPYPNGDPRPWWFRDFERRDAEWKYELRRELHEVKGKVEDLDDDRQRRGGIIVTGRSVAIIVGALSAVAVFIVALAQLIGAA